jgi:hypothetical protein
MALSPRDVPITREETYEWLQEYAGQFRATKKMRDYLSEKIVEKGLDPEEAVDTSGHDNLPNETAVVDMILMDIESYGNSD